MTGEWDKMRPEGLRPGTLYEFPVAALTSHHNLSGLKQEKFTLLQLWRPEPEIKVPPEPHSLQRL